MAKPIAFIGYRATGKTTTGKLLAEKLKRPFFDSDAEIVLRAGKTIAEIFRDDGETEFRNLETLVIKELTQRPDIVLSLGGGAILREENRTAISEHCEPVVYLVATVDTIARRIYADAASQQQRPKLTKKGGIEEIREVLEFRLPLYESLATMTIDTETQTPEEVAAMLADNA